MIEFINNLTLVEKIFFGCAATGGGLFVIRFALLLFGGFGDMDSDGADFDSGGAEFDVDGTDGLDLDGAASFHLLSMQGITGFFMIFGTIGLAMTKQSGLGVVISLAGATVAGFLAMWIIAKVYSLMKRLQSSGTLKLNNAIGTQGSVYLTIPAGGTGKVRIVIQNSLKIFDAISEDKSAIKTDDQIEVTKIVSGNVFVVKKV